MPEDTITRLNAALEGRYRIERQLGEGGMATVYLARDEKHNRNVALKVLKPELAAVVGAERFLAEIETTANLQHPHILPLFDSGEADKFLFYVMPYVEGESLRERLDREHQLPVDEAVQITKNVAEALDYAHKHGVIHRDIKPANILMQAGKPVISDFGIALAVTAGGAGRLTETGLSLGTPHYMSPEQATGDLSVGAATDIYALGCVLYEMLVGHPPYIGGTPQAILGKIIQAKPVSATEERGSVPPNVDAAIRKALEKVPADRFIEASEFARALADTGFRHGALAAAGASAGAGPWKRLSAGLAGLAALLALGQGWSRLRPESPLAVTRFEIGKPDSLGTNNIGLAMSPDGRQVVFPVYEPDGTSRLYRRDLSELAAVPIPGTDGVAYHWRFSPDGQSLAFTVEGHIETIPVIGGTPTVVVPDGVPNSFAGVAWGTDGMIYFRKVGAGLWRVPASGGEQEELTRLAEGEVHHAFPDVLPNGEGLLFTVVREDNSHQIAILSLETGEMRTLVPGGVARYADSGHLLYTSADGLGTLMAVPFDADRLEITGTARPVIEGLRVQSPTDLWSEFEVSRSGDLVYRATTAGPQEQHPVWLDRAGRAEVVDPNLANVLAPAISPDGSMIAFERGTPEDIWVYDVADETLSRITFGGSRNMNPFWSPDGTQIGFTSDRDGSFSLYERPVNLSGESHLLVADPGQRLYEGSWTPDGRWIVYRSGTTTTGSNRDIEIVAPRPDSVPRPIVATDAEEWNPAVSPDGRWLAYASDESGQPEVYVRPLAEAGGRTQVSRDGGISPLWSHDGRQILYIGWTSAALTVATVRTAPDFGVESRQVLFDWVGIYRHSNTDLWWDVSPVDDRVLGISWGGSSFANARDFYVQNFFEELKRLAPN